MQAAPVIVLRAMYVPVIAVKTGKCSSAERVFAGIWLPCDCRHTRSYCPKDSIAAVSDDFGKIRFFPSRMQYTQHKQVTTTLRR